MEREREKKKKKKHTHRSEEEFLRPRYPTAGERRGPKVGVTSLSERRTAPPPTGIVLRASGIWDMLQ